MQCKCGALLKLGKFAEALKAFDAFPEQTASQRYERAYCLYRLRRFDEATRALDAVPAAERTEGFLHLQAQVLYQSGQYAAAAELYERHFASASAADLDAELKANIVAAFVSAGQPQKVATFLRQCGHREGAADETYELAYNVACALADLGDLAAARLRLEGALATGERALRADGLRYHAGRTSQTWHMRKCRKYFQ